MTDAIIKELRALKKNIDRLRADLKAERAVSSPRLLTYAEAARELGLGAGLTKLREMVRTGELKTVAVGKRQRVPRSEVERLSLILERPVPFPRRKRESASAQTMAARVRAALRADAT